MAYQSEQETFWAGDFGNHYVERNLDDDVLATKTHLFGKILHRTGGIGSAIEFGANIGLNLRAIRTLRPSCQVAGVEINEVAMAKMKDIPGVRCFPGSIFEFDATTLGRYDLTFTCGVLIHINPNLLPAVYERLYACSREYICVAEYYNPSPVEIPYREHDDRLFKRDFAGDLLDRYPDLELVDYGFQYRRDPSFPADDITWFLLRKNR